jgi:TRAP-type uncharacterized transport system fused permease subunit
MKTAFTSWKLSKGLYIIPIVMAYRPLLGGGNWWEVTLAIVTCALGLMAFAAVLDRYLLRQTTWLETILLLAASLCLFWPDFELSGTVIPAYATDFSGAVLLTGTFLLQKYGPQSLYFH